MKHYYTRKAYTELLESMVILVDTRENANDHITKWFDDNNIKWKSRALKTGDYSFMIPKNEELGYMADTYFTDELCIERKNSVGELAGNIAQSDKEDDRFFKELNRMINIDNVYVVIERDSLATLIEGQYRSQLNADAFLRTLLSWQKRNGMFIYFAKPEHTGKVIYEICRNALDNSILKS